MKLYEFTKYPSSKSPGISQKLANKMIWIPRWIYPEGIFDPALANFIYPRYHATTVLLTLDKIPVSNQFPLNLAERYWRVMIFVSECLDPWDVLFSSAFTSPSVS